MDYFIDQHNTLTPATAIFKGAGIKQPNIFTYPNPLKVKSGYGWRLVNGEPVQLIDKRGTIYSKTTAEPRAWQALGELPEGYTHLKPEAGQVWTGNGWDYTEAQKLVTAYNQKLATFNQQLSEKNSSFYSNVTGTTYRYSTDNEAQLNLTGVVMANIDCPYICYKDDQRLSIDHSAEQLRELGLQITAHKAQTIATHAALLTQLNELKAANNLTAIEALSWPNQ